MLISIVSRPLLDDINGIIECNMTKCTREILAGGATKSSQIYIDLKYPLIQV